MKKRVWLEDVYGSEPAFLIGESSQYNCVKVLTANGIENVNINFILDYWGNPLKGQA